MTSRSDKLWTWRRLVAIGVVAMLVAGGLHFMEQRLVRETNMLLDDLSMVRAAVYRAVAVAEMSAGNRTVPMQPVNDLRRVTPQIERLSRAALPDPDRRDLDTFLAGVHALEGQLLRGGLTEAEIQAALSGPDAISLDIDQRERVIREARREDLSRSWLVVTVVATGLFVLAVVGSRRAERRRGESERLLAEREEHYRSMVDALQEGVLVLDPEGRVQAGNAAAERIVGQSVDEMNRADPVDWQFFDEQGRRLQRAELPAERAMATGQPVRDLTLRVQGPSVPARWLVFTAVRLNPAADGSTRGAVVTFADVTAERAARSALAESESTSQALMNALQDGVFVAQSGAFVLCNPSLARLLGYTREEFEGLPFEAVVEPSQLARWQGLMRMSGDEAGRPQEVRFLARNDGPPVDFELMCSLVGYRGQEAVLGLVRDISERRLARAELQLYRSHLEEIVRARTEELETALLQRSEADTITRLIADNIPGRLAYWDGGLRCRFVNRVHAEALGRDASTFVGRVVDEVFDAPQVAVLAPRMRSALAGHGQRFEVDEPDGAGGSRRILHQFVPDLRGREVEGFFALALDVTEGRDARAALQRLNDELVIERDRSAAASTAKSAFLANMSHEIRTPMNAIIGLTHLMRRENPGGTLGERLGRVAVAAQHLLHLLDDILDLSKIDAGKLLLDDTDFTLDSLLSSACELVTDAARDKGVSLIVETDHVPQRLRGDPMRLSQALVNLLGNAVKFIEHGSVTLAARLLEQAGSQLRLRLEVRDTGPGIPPDKLATLFDAFEQADSSTTRRFGGTGLGLAITRQLAELMDGSAGVESRVGVGSTFWIEVTLEGSGPPPSSVAMTAGGKILPDASQAARVGQPPTLDLAAETSVRDAHAGAMVLLAEDNRINEEVAVTLLTQAGLQVEVARDGLEAVAMAARAGYDLILMDMQMPLLDGPAAAQRIRATSRGAHVPIVALTASAYVEDRDRCMAAGMNDFIAKPVDPPRLYATIAKWLGAESLGTERLAPREPVSRNLEHIDGLDASRGLAFFGGDDKIFRQALDQYCGMYGAGLGPATSEAGAQEAWSRRLQRDLHAFAGASSAVGASQLGQAAARIEVELKRGARGTIDADLDELNARLRRFLSALQLALAAEA